MSDFTSPFWSHYVTIITVVGIAACLILLLRVALKRVDPKTVQSTGHKWDEDLEEMNNPLPAWWMGLFVLTIAFAVGYLYYFPGLGSYEGSGKWTQTKEWQEERDKAHKEAAPVYAAFAGKSMEELAKDPQAMQIAERLFLNNCALCHGSDARGSKGFPNLTDKDWLGGSDTAYIHKTIAEGRMGVMPPMVASVGSPEDVRNLAHYVLSLSGSPHDSVRAGLGKAKFGVCAACHGMDGKGNQALGAPNLTDNVWLHGFGEDLIAQMINHGKTNVMPPQKDRYDETQLKLLSAYVWGFSNNGSAAVAQK